MTFAMFGRSQGCFIVGVSLLANGFLPTAATASAPRFKCAVDRNLHIIVRNLEAGMLRCTRNAHMRWSGRLEIRAVLETDGTAHVTQVRSFDASDADRSYFERQAFCNCVRTVRLPSMQNVTTREEYVFPVIVSR